MSEREKAVREAFEAREKLQALLADARSSLRSGDFAPMEVPPVIVESLEIIRDAEAPPPEEKEPGRPRERTGNSAIDEWREKFLNRGEDK